MARLSLSLLGPFRAVLDGKPVTAFESDKVRALLTYLAVEPGRPHRRETLAGLLWPERTERNARRNLSQALFKLRRAIGDHDATPPFLIVTRQTVQFDGASDHRVDVTAFTTLLETCEQHHHHVLAACAPCVERLQQAVALYGGSFLDGFSLGDSPAFEEWSLLLRERLHRLAMEALHRLADCHEQRDEFEQALEHAWRQVELDPWREEAHQQVMRLLALGGQRGTALAQYEACRRLLAEELGVEPAKETALLYEQIRDGTLKRDVAELWDRPIRGYELRERIGTGGFGVVYRAYQPSVGREVAIKAILPEYANHPDFIRRFEAEAQLVARLEHLHIVPLYDYWREPDGAYLVMRWLRGGNLRQSLQRGPWVPEATARLLDQAASALAVAHRQGIVHRDVKPENILLDEDGNAYLSDFGIAKDLMRPTGRAKTGAVVSSPAYVSPEQAQSRSLMPQSDIYSLGVVMYETLAGEHPFSGATPAEQLVKHMTEPLPPLRERRPELPEAVEGVIQRATAKDPAERYPDALALATAFREAISGATVEAIPTPSDWAAPELVNPYKGLRAFEEADAADFFGREALTEQLLARLGEEDSGGAARFLAVVGPSGSGKSSVVKAGLLPALRRGALPGSDEWFVVEMLPGAHPLDELEIGLLHIAVGQQAGLMEQLRRDERGLLRAARLVLPTKGSELLLVIDQFEELFTRTVDRAESEHLLQSLCAVVSDPRSRVRVIITLRADFYDRPLMHRDLGGLMRQRTEVVVPLTSEELARAIRKPAEQAGTELETGLVTTIVTDVSEQPGALPMLQYALTELFERREGYLLTQEAYQAIGGVSGALARRAEEVYAGLDEAGQAAARQLFLRLVTLGEGTSDALASRDTRRRVLRGELRAVDVDQQAMEAAVEAFGRSRLLLFDRDPTTRAPTVEVAHEALLGEWGRLSEWLDESRADVRMERLLAAAVGEWIEADRDPSFLLRGARLAQFEGWAAGGAMALTKDERAYLEASIAAQEARRAEEAERQRHELEAAQKLAESEHRRAEVLKRGALALAGVSFVAIVLAVIALVARSAAQREAAANHSLVLAANAQQTHDNGEVDLALALALEAVRIDQPPPEAIRTLSAIAFDPGTRAALEGHSNDIRDVVFGPDGQTALSGSCGEIDADGVCVRGELILWNVSTAAEVEAELHRFEGHTGWVNGVALSPDGETALSGSGDGTLVLWDVETGGMIRRFEGHTGGVNSVAFSPDSPEGTGGRLALSGSDDTTLILWNVATGEEIRRFEGHTGGVTRVAFSPDGQTALSGSDDTTLILWDVATGEAIRRFEGHFDRVIGVVFHPDGRTVLSVGGDGGLCLWDLETGEEIHRQQFFYEPRNLAISPDGHTVIVLFASFEVRLWNLEQWRETRRLRQGTRRILGRSDKSIAISPDGRLALSGSADDTLRLWNLAGQAEIRRFETDSTPFTAVDVSSDGRRLLAGTLADEAILWDVESGEILRRLRTGIQVCPGCVAFSPDERYAMIGSADFLGGSDATSLVLWDIETGEEIRRFEGHRTYVRSLAFSPDGRTALGGSQCMGPQCVPDSVKGDLILWDLETGEQARRFETSEDMTSIVFSADGSRALSGSAYFSNLILWDVATGQEIRRFEGHTGPVLAVAFGPDETTAISASEDGSLILWDVETGDIIRYYLGHNSTVMWLDVSPDGRYVISSSLDGTVILWDFETGEELRRFSGHTAMVWNVAFSPDGQTAFSASTDGTLIQWQVADLPLDELIEWIHANRYVRDLTCDEREQYRIEPLCNAEEVATIESRPSQ